jgi:hypothetical protein
LLGKTSFLFIEDAANIFIGCSQATFEGAHALNIRGEIYSSEDFVKLLHQIVPESKNTVTIKPGASPLPLAYDFAQKGLDKIFPYKYTSLQEGIKITASKFKELQSQGLLKDNDLLD